MEIGEKIKQARLKLGMSQAELGEKLGVQRSAVSKWEKGQVVNIKRSTLLNLSKHLGISPAELVIDESGTIESDNIDSMQYTIETKGTCVKEPTPGYRIVTEEEIDEIWEKIYEMSAILNINRKQKLLEYALNLLKEQREEIDQMLELAKGIKK